MKRRALLHAALVLAAPPARAQQDNSIAAAMNDLLVRPERDIAYGPDRRQRFDAYVPGTPRGPLLLLVHGGGWSGGDKRSGGALAKVRYFTARGYVVASTNYRLLPQARGIRAVPISG